MLGNTESALELYPTTFSLYLAHSFVHSKNSINVYKALVYVSEHTLTFIQNFPYGKYLPIFFLIRQLIIIQPIKPVLLKKEKEKKEGEIY